MARNSFQWDDPFQLDQQLSEDERMIRDAAHAYCQEKLAPPRAGDVPPRKDRR